MVARTEATLATIVLEQLETVHTERVTVSLPDPAKCVYKTKIKNCKISSRVIKKSVQIKSVMSLDTLYIEEKSMALKIFSWDWEITVFVLGQQTFSGTHSRTKLLNDSIIHSMLQSPYELVFDAKLHFISSILKDEILTQVQAEPGKEEVELGLDSPKGGQELFVPGLGTIQFEIE